jgi:nucleoside-diphosphate-sugar epimerase
MVPAQTHVFTGATGLIGSAIVLELLQAEPNAQILAVVRAPDGSDAGACERLHRTLERAARLYGLGDALDVAIHERCLGLHGDLNAARCGIADRSSWRGAEMWHCAASLEFHDRHQDKVMQTNVEGTRHALELAEALEVRAFNMISTAYIVGAQSGLIHEAIVEESQVTNNHYERSKILAEGLVRACGLRARVLRPSIVIGHSRTRAALTFSGLYGFERGVFKFRRLMERTQAGLMATLTVSMLADADGSLDLLPVDLVARDALGLSRADAEPGVYHLAGVARLPTRRAIELTFAAVGLRPPRFVDDPAQLTWIDRKLDQAVSIYKAYLWGDKRFQRAHTDRWLSRPAGADYRLPEDELRRFCEQYYAAELAPRVRPPEPQ